MEMDLATFLESQRSRVTATERCRENEEMLARYGQLFHPANIPNLTAEEFKSFLSIKNNKHWEGIHRQSGLLTRDMERLREALGILVDEERPLPERLAKLFPKGQSGFVKGLGRAVATPILTVVYPEEYGVFNSRSERALEHFGLFPDFEGGASFADRYTAVNEILNQLAHEYDLSLLELDEVFGWFGPKEDMEDHNGDDLVQIEDETIESLQIDVLERFLSDFLVYNWEKTSLGQRYELYEEDGDIAQEYPTPIGRIDLLARDRDNADWVVIELKRGRSSDVVVGQLLRYMGWVQEHLTGEGEAVRGVVIAGDADDRLQYALKPLTDKVTLLTYTVQFDVQEVLL
jgi:hypothetical protein